MSESTQVRVLLMEDDSGLARLFEKRLRRLGYHVEIATDGEEGLAMYDAGSYDILVTDQMMPVYTGLDVIRILAERGPLPPIIMVTGTGSEQIAVEAMKLGASDYLVKDVDGGYFELLPSVIEQALQQHRLMEAKRKAEEERKRLLVAEREQRLLAETLAEVALALTSLTDLDAVLDEILHQVQRVAPYSAANITLLEGDTLRIARQLGYEQHGEDDPYLEAAQPLADAGVDRDVVELRKPLVIPNTREDPRWTTDRHVDWIRSHLAVPISLRDRVIGLLRLNSATAGEFSERDVERLNPLASAAAIALENARLFEEVQRLANIDELTGIYNRRRFFELAEAEMKRAHRFGHPISAIMLDIDCFKEVNDTYGHAIGDQVLQVVADRCVDNIRDIDVLGRYGGEEFAVVLPETDMAGATALAERLRRCISDHPIATDAGDLCVTISLGVASSVRDDLDVNRLLDQADSAMYDAKKAGRNRVMAA